MAENKSISSSEAIERYRGYARGTLTEKQVELPQRGRSREAQVDTPEQRYGVFILHLLQQPDYTVEHPSLAAYVREELGFDEGQWYGLRTYLGNNLGAVQFDQEGRRYIRATAQIEVLRGYIDKPFVGDEIASALAAIPPTEPVAGTKR